MNKPRKMLGSADHPTVVQLMRQMDTQSARTLAAWSASCARGRWLPIAQALLPDETRLCAALDAVDAHLAGEKSLKEVKAAVRDANDCARELSAQPVAQAAARAVATAASAAYNPASALGMTFYGVAAAFYDREGWSLPAAALNAAADAEFASLLASLRAASVPDEPNPARIRWNC